MTELFIGIVGGAIFSWVISHIYYKKSSKQIPDWAKPIIAKLPEEQPTKDKLLELFQDALDKKDVHVDPLIGHVACPKCKASAKDFKKTVFGDDTHTIVVVECPYCGWSETIEV